MNTYYDYAYNSYLHLINMKDIQPYSYNSICAESQSVCERMLKYIVELFVNANTDSSAIAYADILRTHSVKRLLDYLEAELPDFDINYDTVVRVNGYYFEVRYPGENSYFAKRRDVDISLAAVRSCVASVTEYINQREES